MKVQHLIAIALIFLCSSAAWFLLGGAMNQRTSQRSNEFQKALENGWGPPLTQLHPEISYRSPTSAQGNRKVRPEASRVEVHLAYEPKRRGLLWNRTYQVDFLGQYEVVNPTPVTQTLFVTFQLPSDRTSFYDFAYQLGDAAPTGKAPENGVLTEAIVLAPGERVPLRVTYRARGVDQWRYAFADSGWVRQFTLEMTTDFAQIDFPEGTGSPTDRQQTAKGWQLEWAYPDVLDAQAIGMAMPKALNPGPVATRIAFFAPVSLLFFFTVLLLLGMVRQVAMHPMHYFFLAAAFFAFALLFAYLVDLVPVHLSFLIAAGVSMALVGFYTHSISRGRLTWIAVSAQFAYLVLFSYSFFFDGLTGLVITIGAVITLALLMAFTSRIDWERQFQPTPPPLPTR